MIRVTNDKNSDVMYFNNITEVDNFFENFQVENNYYITFKIFQGTNAYCLENDYTYIEFYAEEC